MKKAAIGTLKFDGYMTCLIDIVSENDTYLINKTLRSENLSCFYNQNVKKDDVGLMKERKLLNAG